CAAGAARRRADELALAAIAVAAAGQGQPAAARLSWAAVLFTAALGARALDLPLCGRFPLGVHFVWHIAAALGFYLLVSALGLPLRRGERPGEGPAPFTSATRSRQGR
ncbi:MAG: hypothetical protein LW852_12410, partial [Sediminibacterium sp.]|nr:hypothetical protein [Sediminibacterium sp.]